MRSWLLAAILAPALTGCTSLPFAPESGPGAALTLVTLETIEEREREIRRSFEETVVSQVETAVREAREEDREQLAAFAERLENFGVELTSLSTRVDTNAETSLELAQVVDGRLGQLAVESAALAAQARAMEAEIGGLPVATLDRLRRVLEAHVETTEAAEAAEARARQAAPPAVGVESGG
ncbi:MAG: hypothetical protein NXI30_02830 [bacterium]|nr:hypothetical protein [bacterium]